MSLRDAVLASIAAPTYFPPHSAEVLGKIRTWTDGGVGVHGNPCSQTAFEALSFSNGKYLAGETRLLSFGTGRIPNPIEAHKANALTWLGWTLGELLQDTAEWQTFATDLEYDQTGRLDFRRYQLDFSNDVMDEIGRAFSRRINFDDPEGLIPISETGW